MTQLTHWNSGQNSTCSAGKSAPAALSCVVPTNDHTLCCSWTAKFCWNAAPLTALEIGKKKASLKKKKKQPGHCLTSFDVSRHCHVDWPNNTTQRVAIVMGEFTVVHGVTIEHHVFVVAERALKAKKRSRDSSRLNKSEEAWSLMWNAICC